MWEGLKEAAAATNQLHTHKSSFHKFLLSSKSF